MKLRTKIFQKRGKMTLKIRTIPAKVDRISKKRLRTSLMNLGFLSSIKNNQFLKIPFKKKENRIFNHLLIQTTKFKESHLSTE